jgi:predicted anti-sigma-YlaC factor YlaD
MKIKIDCQEASRMLSAQLDGTLPVAERARVRLHVVLCDACRSVEEQFGFLRAAMKRLGNDEQGPDRDR